MLSDPKSNMTAGRSVLHACWTIEDAIMLGSGSQISAVPRQQVDQFEESTRHCAGWCRRRIHRTFSDCG